MASFTGTLDKCKACDKTVYFVDLLSADGATYHKACFKCSHCKGTLVMSNYSSMDGVLYCKTHFEQLFKESGNFSKNFQSGKHEKDNSLTRAPSKLSSVFCGTQDKCPACSKIVYPLEKMSLEGESFHKSCFKCAHGGCPLTHSSYASLDGILYCKHHFQQLFMEKGNYQHVIEAGRKSTADSDAEVIPAIVAAAEADADAKPDSDEPESEEKAQEQS
ncbi:GATA type zinc finger transcription factor family protein [Perilla frutescens var. hirtella]|uniref:GATA type zinc finger transcription factor family protein n=1 Tax=Perilla frutescens var. hirtella TaxID=608512 RepID=A0AAD4JRU4_PERFH|nr:GATA type zinc finger transcription factor family protein [Perilla frutescens var. hirtella]KAH6817884.1 GATA type zinc finger transcription factor family protein [Perilla frutescens var. frutescens]KAH6838005.1 GATA type zinc finger transcription factor family protein [Perilla frutescens var. hirtella]